MWCQTHVCDVNCSADSSSTEHEMITCDSHFSDTSYISRIADWCEPDDREFSESIRIVNIPEECASIRSITAALCKDYVFFGGKIYSSSRHLYRGKG